MPSTSQSLVRKITFTSYSLKRTIWRGNKMAVMAVTWERFFSDFGGPRGKGESGRIFPHPPLLPLQGGEGGLPGVFGLIGLCRAVAVVG
ncbi:hypothetical protein Cflav_PD0760 [Pedosphaera parvula Ellin514]|uniref:Uncharacterized protein n=1 Tax=Pedosphaera parvula (strain Ellin514) TaxID=320771 RepID=B9XR02_PEDPL|nr:hypothetical protein Cflav_PD0760 [Pedosphaera parvula Ellin514]